MGGNTDSANEPTKFTEDEGCTGCSCNCGCTHCLCRIDIVADESNQDHYGNEGGPTEQGVPTLPMDILLDRFPAIHLAEASLEDRVPDPNEAPAVPVALTRANITSLTHSYSEANSYQEEWLRQYRMLVDENPAPHFVHPDTEMFDDEGVFGPMELEGSMVVEDSIAGDSHSTMSMSQMTCPRSHSSRSGSQVVTGAGNFVTRPLPLLPEVPEFSCEKCGCEHE